MLHDTLAQHFGAGVGLGTVLGNEGARLTGRLGQRVGAEHFQRADVDEPAHLVLLAERDDSAGPLHIDGVHG